MAPINYARLRSEPCEDYGRAWWHAAFTTIYDENERLRDVIAFARTELNNVSVHQEADAIRRLDALWDTLNDALSRAGETEEETREAN